MDLSFSEEQKIISSTADKYFNENYSFEKRLKQINDEEQSTKHWTDFSEMGWLGLPFSEESGGLGGNITDIMVLMESFGKALVLDSYVIHVLVSGMLLEKQEKKNIAKNYLLDLLEGKKRFTFAFAESNSGYNLNILSTVAVKEGDDYFLQGKKTFVIGLEKSDFIIFPAIEKNTDNIVLFCTPKNLESLDLNYYRTLDDTEAGDITFNNVKINQNMVLGIYKKIDYLNLIENIIDFATLATCSDALGIIDKMYDKTLEYAKTREQFGKKIGSFQVIQHKLVDIYIKKEEMRSLNYMAQISLHKSDTERKKSISLNKVFLGLEAKKIGQECIQIHGGMGVANEMDIGHYFKRLTVMCGLFGNSDYHLKRYADNDI